MNRPFLAVALLSVSAFAQKPAPARLLPETAALIGDWNGALQAGPQVLHLVLHLKRDADAWSCTLDSVDQGANGIPCSVTSTDVALTLDVPMVHGGYTGKLEGDTLTGTWTQGADLPLTFTRASKPAQ